ncbi:hypothetical protein SRIMR7_32055 [Streptomyces rimosus subsp. rimosus]|uniref:Uncharacterized protein n=1 Tax=Streptomyces rimosus subsp. rimosus TaxID=132474 RepID=A0ABY3Z919_STRRM|nr:hypothetical protein SRIMR7_32055 [Streptomyces rimosus subsp. rimosus]
MPAHGAFTLRGERSNTSRPAPGFMRSWDT